MALGICDFQYLPASKKSDGSLGSIKDKIFPILGAHENPETLVMKDLINEEARCQTFSLPPYMSRIDNPPVCDFFKLEIFFIEIVLQQLRFLYRGALSTS